jgi:hypothetical protein
MVGEYPLEIGMVGYAVLSIINLVTNWAPSNALRALPDMLEIVWAILMGLAAVTIASGLVVNRFAVVSTGMYLFATILVAYSIAIVSASGWQRGGAIAGFLAIIGIVCFLRGWWLKEQEAALINEIERKDA